jgi:hypothetical protein
MPFFQDALFPGRTWHFNFFKAPIALHFFRMRIYVANHREQMVSYQRKGQHQEEFIVHGRCVFLMKADEEEQRGDEDHMDDIDPDKGGVSLPSEDHSVEMIGHHDGANGQEALKDPGGRSGPFETDK